jgi:TolB-like protein
MAKPGKNLIVFVLLFLAPAMLFALPQVAVLDTILSAGMDPAVRSPVTDKIVEELVKCGKYIVLDRASVAQVLKEKEFQLSSGLVGNEEIRRAGEYLGADLVVVASASRVGSTHVITVKMIDVLSGRITAQASEEKKGTIDVLLQIARTAGQRIAGVEVTAVEAAPAAPVAPAAPAAPAAFTADAVLKLQMLIKNKAFLKAAGKAQMLQLASRLSESDKMYLYSASTKDDAAIGLGLNLLLTSLGSWVQGDTVGALTEITLALAAIMAMTNGWDEYYDYYYGYYYSEPNALFYLGVGCLVFNIVYMCARPFSWVKTWNRNLAESLGVIYIGVLDPEESSFSLTPDQDNKWALKVNLLSVKY